MVGFTTVAFSEIALAPAGMPHAPNERVVADRRGRQEAPAGQGRGQPLRVSTRRHGFTGNEGQKSVDPVTRAVRPDAVALFASGAFQYGGAGQFARPEASVSSGRDAKAEPVNEGRK